MKDKSKQDEAKSRRSLGLFTNLRENLGPSTNLKRSEETQEKILVVKSNIYFNMFFVVVVFQGFFFLIWR